MTNIYPFESSLSGSKRVSWHPDEARDPKGPQQIASAHETDPAFYEVGFASPHYHQEQASQEAWPPVPPLLPDDGAPGEHLLEVKPSNQHRIGFAGQTRGRQIGDIGVTPSPVLFQQMPDAQGFASRRAAPTYDDFKSWPIMEFQSVPFGSRGYEHAVKDRGRMNAEDQDRYDSLVREQLEGRHEQRTQARHFIDEASSYQQSWLGRVNATVREGAWQAFSSLGGVQCVQATHTCCTHIEASPWRRQFKV